MRKYFYLNEKNDNDDNFNVLKRNKNLYCKLIVDQLMFSLYEKKSKLKKYLNLIVINFYVCNY